jgi:uncharacterized protein (UPF0371 family)
MMGLVDKDTVERSALLMDEVGAKPEDRRVVEAARAAAEEAQKKGKGNDGIYCGAALELENGKMITGKNSPLLHAASSLVLNAVKDLAEIPDRIHILAPNIIDSISNFKKNILGAKTACLDLEETLISLSISAAHNPSAQLAMEKLRELKGCEAHMTHIPNPGDAEGLRRLGVNLTSDPNLSTKSFFEGA